MSVVQGNFVDALDFQPAVNRLYLSFVSEANGAVPTFTTAAIQKKSGFSGCVRNSTGNYTATFDNYWAAFLGGGGSIRQTGGAYDATKAFNVKVYAYDASAHTVSFVTTRPDSNAAADMASGDILDLCVRMGGEVPLTPGAPVQ